MIWIQVDKDSDTPMIRQLYNSVRDRILAGKLEADTRLPSTRELAAQLTISRNVVTQAYELLYAEGYLATRRGSGTFVAQGATLRQPAPAVQPAVEQVSMGYDAPDTIINFKAGTPDLSLFPQRLWLRLIREVFTKPTEKLLVYGHPEGRSELREAICHYVVTQREVNCHPDQILITAGTTQAIGIACHLLLGKKNDVVLEDPITRDIQLIAQSHGAIIHPVGVDSGGMRTTELPTDIAPAFIYATPSHQFPIGGTLPIQRRIELLEYARKNEAFIIEDDYDSEFRFDGPPLSSLHGLAPERVIYIGTFSKTLCPAVRIGYLILPHELINLGRTRKWHSDLHNEVISQLTLARFIAQGHYLRHVRKMRKHYLNRRRQVVHSMTSHFGNQIEFLGSSTGLHLVARFPGRNFTPEILGAIEAGGARFYPVETHAIRTGNHQDKLIIGYGHLSPGEIRQGIEILARQINEL